MNSNAGSKKEFEIMIYDCGPGGTVSVKSLFNYMQAAGDFHSRNLGTSLADFTEKGFTWVYSRFFIRIFRFPQIYSRIECETRRSGLSGNFVIREFMITDINGEKYTEAAASLALIDLKSRKPVPLPHDLKEMLYKGKGTLVKYNFPPIEKNVNNDYIVYFQARYEDMDVNGHINNASYAQMIYESVISEKGPGIEMKTLDLNFKGESFSGETLECHVAKVSDAEYLHWLYAGDDKREILNARSEWAL